MTLIQSEPKAIKIGIPGGDDYSAMQGPCDTGFHIPTKDEWEGVINAGISLGAWIGNGRYDLQNFTTYLKVPALGHIQGWSGNHDGEGSYAQYWACDSTISSGTVRGYTSEAFYYYSGGYYGGVRVTHMSEGNLCPIRAFKDTSITPTSSWTKLYGTSIESGGIFWSSTDGLISISSDGSTWYTMQDKNLGATTVWNYGDSFTDAKCGNYYQRGNNYGFKYSGGWTSSTTTVDASTYGPGNYYSSSTRIKTSESSNYNWDTSKNQNLRGGETGVIQIPDTDIKAVYLGTTKLRPPVNYKTFTITWEEKSDMSSGWTYSDDAAGLTAGDTAFDEFFGYYGCRLNTSGVETDTITQADSGGAGKLDITQLGTLTSGDNVMITFPMRGIKMSKSGNYVTLSITDEPNKDGYQYYAFTKGNEIKDKLYLGAYKITSGYKSLSGASPLVNTTRANFRSGVKSAYDSSAGTDRYSQITWYPRNYINALYMMKHGNPNSQSVVGAGYTGGSAVVNTGGTNSQTNATYGTSSNTQQAKLFGLEDRWGNAFEFLDGCWFNSSTQITVDKTNSVFQDSAYSTNLGAASSGWIGGIAGTNDGMFMNVNATGSGTTYYTDIFDAYANCTLLSGGAWGNSTYAGAFNVSITYPSSVDQRYGSRLMYL